MSPASFAAIVVAATCLAASACGGNDPEPGSTVPARVTPPFTPRVSPVAPPGQDVFYNGNGGWVYQAEPMTCAPVTINGVERCTPIGAIRHICCPGHTRPWSELEVAGSLVGWSGWGYVEGPDEVYLWRILPKHEEAFADLKEAFFGDAEPTPFGTPRSVPLPTAEPVATLAASD